MTQCTSSLSCFALPLVNSPGTSIACDTKEDALARISASGASGGLTGSGNNTTTPSSVSDSTPTSISSSAASTPTSGNSNSNATASGQAPDMSGNDCYGDSSTNGPGQGGYSSTNTSGNSSADSTTGQTPENDSNGGSTTSGSSDAGDGYNGGNSTDSTTYISGVYSAMSDMASTMEYAPSTGYNQMYRRQFTPGSAVPTQTLGTEAPVTTPNAFGVSTVTFLMVSTVTVTASECQGNTDPTDFPSLSSAPGLSPTPGTPFPQSNVGNAQTPFPTVTPIAPTTTISPNGAFVTPTLSPSSNGTPLGDGGFTFTPQPSNGGLAAQPTNGAASNFNLSQLLTATL